jgi:hypothetical protein
MILKELSDIVDASGLDWTVDLNDSILNHETVTLAFHNGPSGLQYNDESLINQQEGKSGNLIKYGGTLNFSNVYLGDIVVWMTYPYIREILENTADFVDLFRLKQEKLSASVVHEAVVKFLREVIAWHAGKVGQEQRIGFKTARAEE